MCTAKSAADSTGSAGMATAFTDFSPGQGCASRVLLGPTAAEVKSEPPAAGNTIPITLSSFLLTAGRNFDDAGGALEAERRRSVATPAWGGRCHRSVAPVPSCNNNLSEPRSCCATCVHFALSRFGLLPSQFAIYRIFGALGDLEKFRETGQKRRKSGISRSWRPFWAKRPPTSRMLNADPVNPVWGPMCPWDPRYCRFFLRGAAGHFVSRGPISSVRDPTDKKNRSRKFCFSLRFQRPVFVEN